jgi:hypothetical protein
MRGLQMHSSESGWSGEMWNLCSDLITTAHCVMLLFWTQSTIKVFKTNVLQILFFLFLLLTSDEKLNSVGSLHSAIPCFELFYWGPNRVALLTWRWKQNPPISSSILYQKGVYYIGIKLFNKLLSELKELVLTPKLFKSSLRYLAFHCLL